MLSSLCPRFSLRHPFSDLPRSAWEIAKAEVQNSTRLKILALRTKIV
jgi:hypothetical protein